MTVLFLVGRIVFALYWLHAAYQHLFKSAGLVGYTQAKAGYKSVGTAKFAVIGTGVLLAIGGITLLLGIWVRLGILCLVIFLLGAAFKMHAYWKETEPNAVMSENIHFWKDIALAAALLMLLAVPLPWMYALSW
ncbi:MAG: DoxX family protein [Candidatus Parcubacteria bacterium]|nr:DoxX family protein [Candidatus Parcubacteria bacterium]